jgi:hypothetical protein
MSNGISNRLFELDSNIRYVAVNQRSRIVEMEQNPKWPSYNPPDTDRMEELIVNPVVLELAKRRGVLDLDGIRYVVIRERSMFMKWIRRKVRLAQSLTTP